jgi:hypothetical protein
MGNGQRATGNGQRATGNGHFVNRFISTVILQQNVLFLLLSFCFKHCHCKSHFVVKITTLTAHPKLKLTQIIGLILLSQWIHVGSANAILTATSSQVIVGNAPQVVALSSANKHGFTVNGVFYSEENGTLKSGEVKEFDGNLTLNDFKVATYTPTNLDRVKNYRDIDGDNADPSQPFKVESTYYWWYDNSGRRITGDDKKKIIGCGSGFSMPLKLIIETKVKAYSEYGIPKESKSVTLAKTYQIAARTQICYAKPNGIIGHPKEQWLSYNSDGISEGWNKNHIKRNSIHGGGFTNDYVPDYGFKAKPTISPKTFPTTGFPGAKFQLVMTGSQSDYRYQILNNSGERVLIDDNGMVLLKNKPTGNITIRVTLKRDLTVYHDYTFNPTSVWLLPQADDYMSWEAAKKRCGGVQNIPSLSMFTNSPQNNIALNTDWRFIANTFTRAIGGGVFAEWGYTDKISYPDSQWGSFIHAKDGKAYYWSSNIHATNASMFVGDARAGNVNAYDMQYNHLVACRG